MIDRKDIEKMAELARIRLSEAEVETMRANVDSILAYVGQIKEAATGGAGEATRLGAVRNVMREDDRPREPGLFTEDLLDAAPARQGAYFKVKKILGGSDNA